MSRIENFIDEVESGRYFTLTTGILPTKDIALADMRKFSEILPELRIDPERKIKVLTHIRASFNAQNN